MRGRELPRASDADGADGRAVRGALADGEERKGDARGESGEDAAEIAVIRKERLRWWGVESKQERPGGGGGGECRATVKSCLQTRFPGGSCLWC